MGIHWAEVSWRISPCCWLQHFANTDQSTMQVTIEEAHGVNLEKNFSCWEKYCQVEQKTELKCMIVTYKADFNCFEYKIWKIPCFSILICWKFEYKQSLLLNDLKWIKLYNACIPVILFRVHFALFAEEQPLWLYTPKYNLFLNLLIWTWTVLQ